MVKQYPLHSGWELAWCPHNQFGKPELAASLHFYPATVPGCTVADLLANGIISDPLRDLQFRDSLWCESQDFWYRCRFNLPTDFLADASANASADDRAEHSATAVSLRFDGLDTFAVIWLNGTKVAETANMFRRYQFPVAELIKPGTNELQVRLCSPTKAALAAAADWGLDLRQLSAAFNTHERLPARKMQMSYGWDNHPRLVMSGIYRPVVLTASQGPQISDIWFQTAELSADHAQATVRFMVQLEAVDRPITLRVELAHGSTQFAATCAVAPQRIEAQDVHGASVPITGDIVVDQPRLWWPNGHGEQPLYGATVRILDGDELLQVERRSFGIRTIAVQTGPALRQKVSYRVGPPDSGTPALDGGEQGPWTHRPLAVATETDVHRFEFSVNGVPLPVVGANWQPCDAVYTRVDRERLQMYLREAQAIGLNMIRVWGGGFIEAPEFYELCSEFGLCVWQDFPFASGIYPQSQQFLDQVEIEAADIVRQLRAHTCLVAWCGDNESDMSSFDRGIDPHSNAINHRILPKVVAELDPGRYYHPTSPWGADYPRSPWSGDNRNWGPWYPNHNYLHIRQEEARFISEGGAYALPSAETIDRGLSPQNQWPISNSVWNLHGGSTDSFFRDFPATSLRMWQQYADFSNLEDAIAVSQFAQAWGAMLLFLHCRRRWPATGGVLWWKLDDCWPCLDGGIVDYCGQPRLASQAIRYACSRTMLVFFQNPENDQLELSVINHSALPLRAVVRSAPLRPDGVRVAVDHTSEVVCDPWSTTLVTRFRYQNTKGYADAVSGATARMAWAEPSVASIQPGIWTAGPRHSWQLWSESTLIHGLWKIAPPPPSKSTAQTVGLQNLEA